MEKKDLRVLRTKKAIRESFIDMICKMDYKDITVKELTGLAGINRKTFYLHYNSLDDLLRELQNEMAQEFINRTQKLKRPEDMDKITREFFTTSESYGKLAEKLLCSGSYDVIGREITNAIMDRTWKADGSRFETEKQNIIMAFVSRSSIEIYKQWIADGKRIPLEEIIDLTTKLICSGLESVY